ncbi:cyclodeaminase/cyclohydrolase family protein [Clostridium weizhouense]|uniref:Cyclodeaminase/cyclohydrolase family protein n=1 Tax=Clostridium weizhouense TaxID=2859781 RepID=A0ABS7ATQ4_9CLOT|nr:cyclodeaminase/cyclohydrolase family protein [Clostridium weizhouense]MBW6410895.1 cyclodeaminase/cyclohydrolase family protein [Clostridium weizhouense]
MEFYKETIKEFVENVSSDAPSPGGGSVAGLIGALSGALNSMVYSLTVGKKSYEALDEDIKIMIRGFQEKSKQFTNNALEMMEEDRKEFLKLMDSYKLPKETDEEKKIRTLTIKENTKKAMMPPLNLARECMDFYKNLNIMSKYGNKMLLSDLGMSAILLHCAIESSIINVKVNLNSLREDKEFFDKIKEELDTMFNNSLIEKDVISRKVNSYIFPED